MGAINKLAASIKELKKERNAGCGSYVAEHTDKDILLWDGYCYVHEQITIDKLKSLKEKHPNAEIIDIHEVLGKSQKACMPQKRIKITIQ